MIQDSLRPLPGEHAGLEQGPSEGAGEPPADWEGYDAGLLDAISD